ncbi:Suppressor of four kinase 1 [Hyphodiscus hymeniophilus]|uniref:Suppressor of four kinase 1 n=1 Tax=Hyphodiscus hymeniophilus TaxID=353542 RepID=A0A9P7AZL4_9HELO|nr:Suppressor of four kinase 1 [Hyphodiscus hymeniophilus]
MYGISYWIVPIFSGFVWLGMLLGMLLWWTVKEGSRHLTPEGPTQNIAYISDIGAHQLQPLFIAAGSTSVVTFTLTFIVERWLRHRGRLVRNDSKGQKILSICSIIAAFVGMIGLIILTCLNDVSHHKAHDACLVIFIGGYIVSAIFICAEYQRLGMHHREHRHLRMSFWIKLAFIFLELGLAIAFGVLRDREKYNPAAVVEWVIAFVYTFYVWSFFIDFIPAVIYKDGFGNKYESRETEVEMATAMEQEARDRGYPGGVAQEQHAYSNGTANNGNGHYTEPAVPSRNF